MSFEFSHLKRWTAFPRGLHCLLLLLLVVLLLVVDVRGADKSHRFLPLQQDRRSVSSSVRPPGSRARSAGRRRVESTPPSQFRACYIGRPRGSRCPLPRSTPNVARTPVPHPSPDNNRRRPFTAAAPIKTLRRRWPMPGSRRTQPTVTPSNAASPSFYCSR